MRISSLPVPQDGEFLEALRRLADECYLHIPRFGFLELFCADWPGVTVTKFDIVFHAPTKITSVDMGIRSVYCKEELLCFFLWCGAKRSY